MTTEQVEVEFDGFTSFLNTLSWNTHITTTVNKANFIKRNLVIQLNLLHIPHLLGQSWNTAQKFGPSS